MDTAADFCPRLAKPYTLGGLCSALAVVSISSIVVGTFSPFASKRSFR